MSRSKEELEIKAARIDVAAYKIILKRNENKTQIEFLSAVPNA